MPISSRLEKEEQERTGSYIDHQVSQLGGGGAGMRQLQENYQRDFLLDGGLPALQQTSKIAKTL